MSSRMLKKPRIVPATDLRSDEVVEKAVLLYAAGGGGASGEGIAAGWYMVSALSSEIGREEDHRLGAVRMKAERLRPIVIIDPPVYDSTFDRIGSTLYCVGGGISPGDEFSPLVHAAEVGRLDEWTCMHARMHTSRSSPETLVAEGRLYVVGGTLEPHHGRTTPWAEVYDPKAGRWTPLPDPPSQPSSFGLFAAYDPTGSSPSLGGKGNTKILLGSSYPHVLYAYDFVSDTWEEPFTKPFYAFSEVSRPVLLNDCLYWIAEGVCVYDLQLQKEMYTDTIRRFYEDSLILFDDPLPYKPMVLHLKGDEFASSGISSWLIAPVTKTVSARWSVALPFRFPKT